MSTHPSTTSDREPGLTSLNLSSIDTSEFLFRCESGAPRGFMEGFKNVTPPKTIQKPLLGDDLSTRLNFTKYTAPAPKTVAKPSFVNGDDEYTVLGMVEQTRNGYVLAVRDQDGEEFAIKVVHKNKAYARGHGREFVLLEQRMMKRITELGNPFLAPLLSSWDDKENVYLVMPLYYTCLYNTACYRTLEDRELQLYTAELVMALSDLHDAGIMHRDIKGENILISPSGHATLADFGLCFARPSDDISCQHPLRMVDSAYLRAEPPTDWKMESNTIVGTFGYMAPEVVTLYGGATYGKEADVWALGMTLLEAAIRWPHAYYCGKSREEVTRLMMTYDPPLDLLPETEFYDRFRDLLSKMLVRSPFHRATAKQLKSHPFFLGIDWEKLKRGQYTPVKRPGFPGIDSEDVQRFMRAAPTEGLLNISNQMCLDRTDKQIFVYKCPDELKAMQYQIHDVAGAASPLSSGLTLQDEFSDVSSLIDDTLGDGETEQSKPSSDGDKHDTKGQSQNDRAVDKEGDETDGKDPAVAVTPLDKAERTARRVLKVVS